jgi:rod shape-determining protein MreD
VRPTLLGLLRTVYVVLAALATATLLPRLGVPDAWVPDLVLLGVVATAVLRGPLHGALAGLLAGWVVELVPPVGSPLGLTALVTAAGGLVAGLFHSPASRSGLRPLVALVAAGAVVGLARAVMTLLAEGRVDAVAGLTHLGSTLAVGLLVVPVAVAVDRALVRRRLG